jgi:hypothetical protein
VRSFFDALAKNNSLYAIGIGFALERISGIVRLEGALPLVLEVRQPPPVVLDTLGVTQALGSLTSLEVRRFDQFVLAVGQALVFMLFHTVGRMASAGIGLSRTGRPDRSRITYGILSACPDPL